MKQMDVALDPLAGVRLREVAARSILAIDPGPEQSGWCRYLPDHHRVLSSGVQPNQMLLWTLQQETGMQVAIETIASYGMPVGRETFDTCIWIGRYMQALDDPESTILVYRKDVKMHLCGNTQAKDSNIRQALLDMFPRTGGGKTPQIGTKKQPGPLFGVSSHAWPALAVAVTVAAKEKA